MFALSKKEKEKTKMVENFKTFDGYREFTYDLAGRPLVVKTGKIAGLANGAALCQYGETTVLCTATASAAHRDGIDFLPLSVDYDEKLYSVGKIPGGFLKREGTVALLASNWPQPSLKGTQVAIQGWLYSSSIMPCRSS